MTRLTWVSRKKSIPAPTTMTRLTRRPRAGRLIGLTFLGRLTILAIVISMARLTGGISWVGCIDWQI